MMKRLPFILALLGASLLHAAPHKVVLIYSSASCTHSDPCTLVVYRAICHEVCADFPTDHMTLASDKKHLIEARMDEQTIWVVIDDNISMKHIQDYVYTAKVIRWRDHSESPLATPMTTPE